MTENMEPIISQTRIVPEFSDIPFLHRKRYSERHLRMYLILDTSVGNAFKDVTAEFVYIPTIELEDDN